MDTTVDALKNIYISLGGEASAVADLTVIPDVINAIETLIQSGATAELPKVSAADNGDVLSVVNGAWGKAALPKELPTVSSSNSGEALCVNSSGKWSVGKVDNNGLAPSFELCTISPKAGVEKVGDLNALFMPPTGMLKFSGIGIISASNLNLASPLDILEILLPPNADLSNTNGTNGVAPIWDTSHNTTGTVRYILDSTKRKVLLTLYLDSKPSKWSGTFYIGAMQL